MIVEPFEKSNAFLILCSRYWLAFGSAAKQVRGDLMNGQWKKWIGDRRVQCMLGGLVLIALVCVFFAWRSGFDLSELKNLWLQTEAFLKDRPWSLFAALVILPGFPVPMSALLILTGTLWRDDPFSACGMVLAAMTINVSWTYWAAAFPARRLVEKLLCKSSIKIPVLPKDDHLRAVLIMRLTPGMPLFVQNYLLGFLHVPFRIYLPVSMLCGGLVACGVVLSGAGVAGGNLMPILTGGGLLVVGIVAIKWIRSRWLRRS